ncbi:crotonobetainyl-CoA:carnitine CoA-transferase CaiB-like acyl-CoA transferase [Pacificitalea manganoxidans]|nr:crotonobetainyl-CoA:carnitine CoA-transferase CaiB-like acyl-CoA transferase [Pacificitalea manganoxidans]
MDEDLPLASLTVLDFSFHLPGPFASLILSRAGAGDQG